MIARLLIAFVRGYRFLLSPWLGTGCRFTPTCSQYAIEALERHGAAKGSWLAIRRLARCQPWCQGGHDPVAPVQKHTVVCHNSCDCVQATIAHPPSPSSESSL